jgi:hypothetical protein
VRTNPTTRPPNYHDLDDQKKPREFAGQKVKAFAMYGENAKTIHVDKIEPAS